MDTLATWLSDAIDWPNLIAGALLSAVISGAVWLVGRRRRRRERYADALAEWIPAARQLEVAIFARGATAGSVHLAWIGYPIDRWRAILGPDQGFRQLEAVESALGTLEHLVRTHAVTPEAVEHHRAAVVAFANCIRGLSSEDYTATVRREERQRVRRDYLRHPLKTWRRERHNASVHREAGLPPGTV